MKRRIWSIFCRVIVAVITGTLLGWGGYILDRTFVDWWWPVGCAVALAAILWIPARKWQWNESGAVVRFCVHMAVVSVFFFWAGMALNYYCADSGSTHEEQAVVERKFKEERHRSRRVGRRYVNSGETYYVYYMELRLPDGRAKNVRVSQPRYRNIRVGSTRSISVSDGLLGLTVMPAGC